jgi:hypothetical protein
MLASSDEDDTAMASIEPKPASFNFSAVAGPTPGKSSRVFLSAMLFSPMHVLLIYGAQLFLLGVGLNKLYESGVKVIVISIIPMIMNPFISTVN